MNNETQPTPDQLAKWREEFAKAFPARPLSAYGQPPNDNDYVFVGYLRAKQENEQAVKVDDHQIALLVNAVTHIAGVYHDSRSLRQRISGEIVPLFNQALKDVHKQIMEEVVNLANEWAMTHIIEDDATLTVGDYIIKAMELKHDN